MIFDEDWDFDHSEYRSTYVPELPDTHRIKEYVGADYYSDVMQHLRGRSNKAVPHLSFIHVGRYKEMWNPDNRLRHKNKELINLLSKIEEAGMDFFMDWLFVKSQLLGMKFMVEKELKKDYSRYHWKAYMPGTVVETRSSSSGARKYICPFHSEKNPSCVWHPLSQTFHCYGCGFHANPIGVVMYLLSLTTSEALYVLARKYGVMISGPKLSYRKTRFLNRFLEQVK